MKHSDLAAIAVVCFALFAVSTRAADLQPRLRLAEVQSVSPVRYRVDLTLDPEKPKFTGAIDIALDVKKPFESCG